MARGEGSRAASLAAKDAGAQKKSKGKPDQDSSSDSDQAITAEREAEKESRKKRELKRLREDHEALDRQIAEAEAKRNAKMAQLLALRNSYPVI